MSQLVRNRAIAVLRPAAHASWIERLPRNESTIRSFREMHIYDASSAENISIPGHVERRAKPRSVHGTQPIVR